MRTIAVRLRPAADLKGELVALAARQRIPAGWVLTCVGSLSQVRLRLAGGAEPATWQGTFEIIALTGTLSQDGGHLHLAVADHQGRTVGGHLAEGCTVRTTAEVVLGADDLLLFARARSCHRLRRAGGTQARPVRPGTAIDPRNSGPFDPGTRGLWRHAPEKRRLD
jgi:predicted DNA-binding protein with PD1-like motif